MHVRKPLLTKFICVCVLAVLALFMVSYLNHLLVSHGNQCNWSRMVDTSCRMYSSSKRQQRNFSSVVVKSVIDDGGNMTVPERAKFQRNQVNKFCDKYNLSTTLSLPAYRHHAVYRHLLINNDAETLFCFVPKVGCTNLKVLYFVAQGLLPPELVDTSSYKRVKDNLIKEVVASNSLTDLPKETCDKLIKNYYKFVMYRHPLERLVSAYRSKVQTHTLSGIDDEQPHYNWLRKKIYKHTRPEEYKEWFKGNGHKDVDISFRDFITYWLENDHYRTQHDEHLMPIFDLCAPCNVRYDYYGHFESFEQDVRVLVEQIGTNMTYLRKDYYNQERSRTSFIALDLYNELSDNQKTAVLERLSQDIDFYYHLFPYKKGSHKMILCTTKELSLP